LACSRFELGLGEEVAAVVAESVGVVEPGPLDDAEGVEMVLVIV